MVSVVPSSSPERTTWGRRKTPKLLPVPGVPVVPGPLSVLLIPWSPRRLNLWGGTELAMSGRGSWVQLSVVALLFGLWLVPVRAQGQPPELEAIYKRGLQLYEAGKFAEAVPIAEEYISVAAATYGEQHPLYATGLGYLGVLFDALNRPSEAELLFKRALAIKEKSLGPDHTEVAEALHNLAELHRKHGQFAEAEPLYQRVLSIAERALGPEHPSIGVVLGNMAELYRAQGRHAEAESLAKRSVAIREKVALAARPALGSVAAQLTLGSGAEEPASLLSQMNQLNRAGKYAEAIPIADRYARSRRGAPRYRGSRIRVSTQQPGHLLQATGRFVESRTAHAPRAGHRREELRPRSSQRRQSDSTIWPSCSRPPTGSPRPSR